MKYLDEFRDGPLARGLAARIRREVEPNRRYAPVSYTHLTLPTTILV